MNNKIIISIKVYKYFYSPNSISKIALDNRRCKESLVSVFRPIKRCSRSIIDGGLIKIYKGLSELDFICLTPSISISKTQILPSL
jgi:hypothetical protein